MQATHSPKVKIKTAEMCSVSDCKKPRDDPRYRTCSRCRGSIGRSTRRLRAEAFISVFEHYGASCACCGTSHREFLTIDHIAGRAPRSMDDGMRGKILYNWLRVHNFPDGFRTLCMSCNFALGFYGHCPHGTLTQERHVGRPSNGKTSEYGKERQRAYNRRVKEDAVAAYGGRCVCCDEHRFELLQLGPDGPGGTDLRKSLRGKNFYVWLKQQGYPPGFKVLCMNCNFSLGHFGYCPHDNQEEGVKE